MVLLTTWRRYGVTTIAVIRAAVAAGVVSFASCVSPSSRPIRRPSGEIVVDVTPGTPSHRTVVTQLAPDTNDSAPTSNKLHRRVPSGYGSCARALWYSTAYCYRSDIVPVVPVPSCSTTKTTRMPRCKSNRFSIKRSRRVVPTCLEVRLVHEHA